MSRPPAVTLLLRPFATKLWANDCHGIVKQCNSAQGGKSDKNISAAQYQGLAPPSHDSRPREKYPLSLSSNDYMRIPSARLDGECS